MYACTWLLSYRLTLHLQLAGFFFLRCRASCRVNAASCDLAQLNASKTSLESYASPALSVEYVEQHTSYWTQLGQLQASCVAGKNKNCRLEAQLTELKGELETVQEATAQQRALTAKASEKSLHTIELLSTLLGAEVRRPQGLVEAQESFGSKGRGGVARPHLTEIVAT